LLTHFKLSPQIKQKNGHFKKKSFILQNTKNRTILATSHPLCIIAVTLCAKAIETGIKSLIDQVVTAIFVKETMVSDFLSSIH